MSKMYAKHQRNEKEHKNKSKKGISPVIATVILVAVAVVIAAALAGFAGSLFGSYSNGPQVKVQSMSVFDDGTIALTMANSGNSADAVTKISVNGHGDTGTGTLTAATIPANKSPVDVDLTGADILTGLTDGMQVTAVISMSSGSTITQTVTVSAAP